MGKSNTRGSLIGKLLLLVFLLSLPFGVLGFYWLVTLPDVSELAKTNPSTTALIEARLADARKDGRSVWARKRWATHSQISPYLRRAVVVAEDANFYSHEGFDWEGIKNAAISNFRKGKLQRGGSTITQQLAKNLFLSSEKNLLRKMREAVITRSLEHNLTKKRILEVYLNVVEWGINVYGAEAAAWHHFRKPARNVTREEAALLAAILPSPRSHDPLRVTPALEKRRQHILSFMKE